MEDHDKTAKTWLAVDLGSLRDALVLQPRPLADLLRERAPMATTRSGAPHVFDPAVLGRIGDALSPLDRRRLRLPVTFFLDPQTPDDAFVSEPSAVALLLALREVTDGTETRDGKLWLGHARARVVAERYPSAFQFAAF